MEKRFRHAIACVFVVFATAGWGSWGGSGDAATPVNPGLPVPADCGQCATLQKEIDGYRAESDKVGTALEAQRNTLKGLGSEQVSQRMQMTSGIFVLGAKLETAQNRLQARQTAWDKGCRSCAAGVKKSTEARSKSPAN